MLEAVGEEAKLVVGKPGQFDVEVDGRLIYSKGQTGRFPEPFEVIEQIK
ncbi:MAG: SelT/SelW/SelH family protein [Polyangiaceae bacterium]|nr:SelT/SelW/SelH family protein [Polyangiaceae bacterium]